MSRAKLASKSQIEPRYDDPRAYDAAESHYGEGRYPPDWNHRCELIWERQSYQCGRCGVYKRDVETAAVHHAIPLSRGGSNSLDNLVGLCCHCHALMHPDNDELPGNVTDAPVFPVATAQPTVAVIRKTIDSGPLKTDLEHLSTLSNTDENNISYIISDAVLSTSAQVARKAERNLDQILLKNGYVPRTSDFHTIEVAPVYTGVRGVVSSRTPKVETVTDGHCAETGSWDGRTVPRQLIRYSGDATGTKIRVTADNGDKQTVALDFDESEPNPSFAPQIDSPPWDRQTIIDLTSYIAKPAIVYGFVPWILAAIFFGENIGILRTIPGMVFSTFLIGFLTRLPSVKSHYDLKN